MHNPSVITIDGPSGVGKGTMATMLANTLGWHFLDSGAIYRLLALKVMRVGASGGSPSELAEMARNLDIYFKDGRTYLDNRDVTDDIRREEVGLMASKTSAFPEVRQALLERQRAFAERIVALARPRGAKVLYNGDVESARVWGCDGVHLTAHALAGTTSRPTDLLCGASCHTRAEIERAGERGSG